MSEFLFVVNLAALVYQTWQHDVPFAIIAGIGVTACFFGAAR